MSRVADLKPSAVTTGEKYATVIALTIAVAAFAGTSAEMAMELP